MSATPATQSPPGWHRSTVPELVDELRAGRCIVLCDDESRENEGDLVAAAEFVTPETINFMITHGRGLVCLAMSRQRCEQLGLQIAPKRGVNPISTNFTQSIEAADGITTGISAEDRATTIRVATSSNAIAAHLRSPGHVFPVMAVDGGVLARAGHTEASTDLCRMVGVGESAVICEVVRDDGRMARRDDIEAFVHKHDLKTGTIADLIQFRLERESTVELCLTRMVDTDYGEFEMRIYRDILQSREHIALLHGSVTAAHVPCVRVHIPEMVQDMLTVPLYGQRWSLPGAMRYIKTTQSGVVLILNSGAPSSVLDVLQPREASVVSDSNRNVGIGVGAQILRHIGVEKFKLLGVANKYPSLSGFGLELVDTVSPPERD